MRAGVDRSPTARTWTRRLSRESFAYASRLQLEIRPLRGLAGPALDCALSRGLSAYEACYVVLAESLGATLVTADRSIAAAVERAELIA
jgi:predicted nucleic acid-binding protein